MAYVPTNLDKALALSQALTKLDQDGVGVGGKNQKAVDALGGQAAMNEYLKDPQIYSYIKAGSSMTNDLRDAVESAAVPIATGAAGVFGGPLAGALAGQILPDMASKDAQTQLPSKNALSVLGGAAGLGAGAGISGNASNGGMIDPVTGVADAGADLSAYGAGAGGTAGTFGGGSAAAGTIAASGMPWYQTPLGSGALITGGALAANNLLTKDPPAPIPPDVAAQTASNIQTADATARINNPNLINQYGTTTFTDPTTPGGRSTMTQTLSPEQQALYGTQTRNQQAFGDIAGKGLESMRGTLGQGFDISGAPAMPGSAEATRQKVIDSMMARQDPKLQQANEQQDADLIAAGIRPGTEAWNRSKTQQGQNRNDMLSQAEITAGDAAAQSFAMDSANRQNEIKNLLTQRQLPLNEINSFMTGSQQTNPFAGTGYQSGAAVQGTDVNAGTNMLNQYNQNVYNQKTAANNQLVGGLFGLGSAYVGSR